jgi:hypothetical protein
MNEQPAVAIPFAASGGAVFAAQSKPFFAAFRKS